MDRQDIREALQLDDELWEFFKAELGLTKCSPCFLVSSEVDARAGRTFDDADVDFPIEEECQFAFDTAKALKARSEQYLPTDEQLDMIYWDLVNGTTKWREHRTKVKTDNLKPIK